MVLVDYCVLLLRVVKIFPLLNCQHSFCRLRPDTRPVREPLFAPYSAFWVVTLCQRNRVLGSQPQRWSEGGGEAAAVLFHLFCINVEASTVSSLINVEVGLVPLVFLQTLVPGESRL